MTLLSNVLGFAAFGVAARFGQLGIQQRNLFSNPSTHAMIAGIFGYAGYWAYKWDMRAAELLALKRAEIAEHRRRRVEAADHAAAASGLQE
ncbi:hypothetical protein BD410DRAFT_784744 [Rickenella mellea]|uniref:NADH-ubiquinone oxidoreductase 14 kDa subunit n=1 Tax=Rickenella mellea TaxID=50990 RepID=A0A4Y7QFS2_9AGAM|nr:hypothetical protein BD410DRAFT_784744 [Rickenella mellea]